MMAFLYPSQVSEFDFGQVEFLDKELQQHSDSLHGSFIYLSRR